MELWTSFLLGLVGSLHCAGMCGPLALALPSAGAGRSGFYHGRLLYNLGRVSAYTLLGLAFGLLGKSVAVAGLQRWTSLAAGAAVLLALLPASRNWLARPAFKMVARMKAGFSHLLQQRTLRALFLMGLLNGFLPCGLTYVACAGAVTGGNVGAGMSHMVAFGLGTLPMMLGIGLAGRNLQLALRFRFRRLVPVCVGLVAVLLIARGLSLGIPYLSPNITGQARPSHCHQ